MYSRVVKFNVPLPGLVGYDVPHGVHDSVVVHIHCQSQRGGNNGPGGEVRASFEEAKASGLNGVDEWLQLQMLKSYSIV